MNTQRPSTSLQTIASMGGFLALLLSIPLFGLLAPSSPTDSPNYGLTPNHLAEAEPLAAAAPAFQLVDDDGRPIVQDNSRANVRLWKSMLAIEMTGKPIGEHLPNIRQEIGDCVSWADANAVTYLGAVQVANNGGSLERAYPPYNYGALRVWIGNRKIRGDGGVVAWGVQALQDPTIGILTFDDLNVPPYSGAIASTWGSKGPPASFRALAKARRVKTASPVKTAIETRDALCNGYPVPFGHGPDPRRGIRGWGTRSCRVADGRNVANWDDQWAHAQCVIGYDGSAESGEKYFCILNSHGPSAHPAPLGDEPPGSYWVTWAQWETIIKNADAWALSDLDGFQARDLIDWDQFGRETRPVNHQARRANPRKTAQAL